MRKDYFIFMPSVAGSFEDEWEQCFLKVIERTGAGYRLLKLNVFVDSTDPEIFLRQKKIIRDSLLDRLGSQCPALSITIHPPENPWKVSAEGMFVRNGNAEVKTKFWRSVPYVVIGPESKKEVWAAGLGDDILSQSTRTAAVKSFDMIYGILDQEEMSFNDLIRQWNYIGNILGTHGGYQNYQTFNEVRSEFYSRYRTINSFPSATGIGMKIGGVYLDFCAVRNSPSVKIKAVHNPNQIDAYQYDQKVLKGLIEKGKHAKNPPQFERALIIANNHWKTLFVSGTASIIGQDTIGKGDVAGQTLVTIQNINKLIDNNYLGEITGQELSRGRCTLIRVYVKDQDDFSVVKDICKEHFPEVPAIFLEADICRDELLVEIEAEYSF